MYYTILYHSSIIYHIIVYTITLHQVNIIVAGSTGSATVVRIPLKGSRVLLPITMNHVCSQQGCPIVFSPIKPPAILTNVCIHSFAATWIARNATMNPTACSKFASQDVRPSGPMVPKLPFVPLVLTMPIVAMVPKKPFVPLVLKMPNPRTIL